MSESETFTFRTRIEAPAKDVFDWHKRPGALERLTPPWEKMELVSRSGGIEDGAVVKLNSYLGPIKQEWVVEHSDYIEGRQFRDIAQKSPFSHWEHTHRVTPDGEKACFLEDSIEYRLPLNGLTAPLSNSFVKQKLANLFSYRHQTTSADIARSRGLDSAKPRSILITGSSGLIGSTLVPYLSTGGHTVERLVRKPRNEEGYRFWDPKNSQLAGNQLEGVETIIHLAGENISSRWTAKKKKEIEESRVQSTKLLCDQIQSMKTKPKLLIIASAIGFYGDRGEEVLSEESNSGVNFMARVCKAWERETEILKSLGIRVVNLRTGIVLSPRGGALEKMLPPFKMGLGGKLGKGNQYMSWISIEDWVSAVNFILKTPEIEGPVNLTSPNPVTNLEFTKVLGKVLKRPTPFPVPEFALKVLFGEMAEELLLSSARVLPNKLTKQGFIFTHPDLETALRSVLGRNERQVTR